LQQSLIVALCQWPEVATSMRGLIA
jgi:hypothetical protein